MPVPKIAGAQRDFSAGEVDESLKRADELPSQKTGARQMSNWRILNSKAVTNRPGRSALFPATGRVEEISVNGTIFFLNFLAGGLKVYNAAGSVVFSATTLLLVPNGSPVAIPWTSNTIAAIVWAQTGTSIYITYADAAPHNVPQILALTNGVWSLTPFNETVTFGGQKRTVFDRISPQNVTLQPSATTGNINITFDQAILVAGMVGTRLLFCGRQLTITGVSSATQGTATVNEALPPGQTLSYTTLSGAINVGDVVEGATSGAEGIVVSNGAEQVLQFTSNVGYVTPSTAIGDTVTQAATSSSGIVIGSSYYFDSVTFHIWLTVAVTAGAFTTGGPVVGPAGSFTPATVTTLGTNQVVVQLIPAGTGDTSQVKQFSGSETVTGPSGSFALTSNSIVSPQAVADWDDEVMNQFRGYPTSVFADQSRLGFTNFPSVPAGIGWSAIGLYADFFVGALADDAIFELAPNNTQVLYIVPGMEGSEFVFCIDAIHYIPITPTVPLEPGSVTFQKLADFGILPGVQPRRAEQSIVFMKPGGASVGAVQAPGAYYRPYVIDSLSEMHGHLFTASLAVSIAIPAGSPQYEELYIYILLANGSLVVGRYAMRQGLIEPGPEGKPAVGWSPWNGSGNVVWVSARQGDVIFSTTYNPVLLLEDGVTPFDSLLLEGAGVNVVEKLDNTQFLDGALLVNSLPAAFTPPGGKGPLYNFPGPNSVVYLIDLGTRFMGMYQVDANGFIVPQNIDGENLSSSQLVAGRNWTATLEPFVPEAQPGQDVEQRMRKRRTSRVIAYVSNSTGFLFARLFAGPITPTSPALGTIMNTYRITTWNQGEDPTRPAPLREQAYFWRPLGRDYDPRRAIIKDTPGKVLVHEIGFEVTV